MAEVILLMPKIGYSDSVKREGLPAPLGLLHAVCLAADDYKIILIDQRIHKDWQKQILDNLTSETLCVATTVMTGPMINNALEMIKFAKQAKNVPVVFGGVHASLITEETLREPLIDFVIQGEGEVPFKELLNCLKNKKSINRIKGVYFKEDGSMKGESQAEPLDLSTIKNLPYNILDMKFYTPNFNGRKSLYMESSRGCPFSCNFCYQQGYYKKKWRAYPAETVINNAKFAKEKYGVEDIFFVDDEFFIDLQRARIIMEALKQNGLTWGAQGVSIHSLNKMDDVYLNTLEKSGCQRIVVGLETGSQRLLDKINKNLKLADIEVTLSRIARFKIPVMCNFLTGFPTESMDEMKQTVFFMNKIAKINRNIMFSPLYFFTPIPGTKFFDEEVSKNKLKKPSSLSEWSRYDYWDNPYQLQLSKKKYWTMQSLYAVSMFIDNKVLLYSRSKFFSLVFYIYRPLARLRFRLYFLRFMPELFLIRFLIKFKLI